MNKTNSDLKIQVESLFRQVFALPDSAFIELSEEDYTDKQDSLNKQTNFTIRLNNNIPKVYIILKPVSEICFEDIVFLKKSLERYSFKNHPLRAKIYRFFGWWFIFAGGITFFSVCPVCGQTGCPVGVGTTGILAGILSLFKMKLKDYIIFIKNLCNNKKISHD